MVDSSYNICAYNDRFTVLKQIRGAHGPITTFGNDRYHFTIGIGQLADWTHLSPSHDDRLTRLQVVGWREGSLNDGSIVFLVQLETRTQLWRDSSSPMNISFEIPQKDVNQLPVSKLEMLVSCPAGVRLYWGWRDALQKKPDR